MPLFITGAEIHTPDERVAPGAIAIVEGRIAALGPADELAAPEGAEVLAADGKIAAPGLLDTHVHGGAGADTMDADPAALATMSTHLARHGVTGFLPTTVAASDQEIRDALARIAQVMHESLAGAAVLGAHIESPYLSPEFVGAQDAAHLRQPDVGHLAGLLNGFEDIVRVVTLAPELPGAAEVIRWLVDHGIEAAIGHSAASYEETVAALDAGLTRATHCFNAMPDLHRRRPGAVGAMLTDPRARVELIADLVHLHPAILRFAVRARGAPSCLLVSDAMRAAGLTDGIYGLGDQEVRVEEGVARTAEGRLAGSTLTLEVAVKNMVETVGVPLADALTMAAAAPAGAIRSAAEGVLRPGARADIVVLNNDLTVSATIVAGRVVYSAAE
jgi:N-acetylglucosamine-6-phosphate deacetylase